jgi:hypothetical protein
MTRFFVLAFSVSLASACTRHPVVTQPPEPGAFVMLLPDPDAATVSQVTVSTPAGTVQLANEYAFTNLTRNRSPSPVLVMNGADADRMFQSVLAGLPPKPLHFRTELADVLRTVRDRTAPFVMVVGHTDTVGTPASNYELGLRRATIVRDLLIGAGLDASTIEPTSHGEGNLLVPTPDDTAEPRNRRVEIVVQ